MKTVAVLLSLLIIVQGSDLDIRELLSFDSSEVLENDGDSAEHPKPQITGGNVATRGQFPWAVMLKVDRSFYCAGALISNRWILTAAECIYGFATFDVYLGMQNWGTAEDGRVIVETRNHIAHDEFYPSTLTNDIGVLKLGQPVTFSEYIQPVTLPSYSMASDDFIGVNVTAAGWGLTSDNDTVVNQDLRYANLTVESNSVCQQSWGANISPGNLCTDGTDLKATCRGDNGGPLVNNDNILIGIQSFFATNGCQQRLPSVFTRVTHYLGWIEYTTGIAINP